MTNDRLNDVTVIYSENQVPTDLQVKLICESIYGILANTDNDKVA